MKLGNSAGSAHFIEWGLCVAGWWWWRGRRLCGLSYYFGEASLAAPLHSLALLPAVMLRVCLRDVVGASGLEVAGAHGGM